jgi:hypothetical protein
MTARRSRTRAWKVRRAFAVAGAFGVSGLGVVMVAPTSAWAASGTVVTVVGTAANGGDGVRGFSANGTPASSAQLAAPQGVVSDGAGDVFVADTDNAVVRMVPAASGTYFGIPMTAGDIYTIAGTNPVGGKAQTGFSGAGGPATSAKLNVPKEITLDNQGDVVLADTTNDVVQAVAKTGGTTLLGVSMPTGGDLYTIAGSGPSGSFNDGGPATKATLSKVHGVAFDASGNLIVTDTNNGRVRLVAAAAGTFYGKSFAATGYIQTVAGNGGDTFTQGALATQDGLSDPHDAVADPTNGNIVIGDYVTSRIAVLAATTGTYDGMAMTAGHLYSIAGGNFGADNDPVVAAQAQFFYPNGLAVDSHGNVIVDDVFNNDIRVVAEATGTFYGQSMKAGTVYTIAGSPNIGVDSGDGAAATAGGFAQPSEVSVDSHGNVLVAEGIGAPSASYDGNRIRILQYGTS